jgi:hypothetical protein
VIAIIVVVVGGGRAGGRIRVRFALIGRLGIRKELRGIRIPLRVTLRTVRAHSQIRAFRFSIVCSLSDVISRSESRVRNLTNFVNSKSLISR